VESSLEVTPEEAVSAIRRYLQATRINVDLESIQVFAPFTFPDVISYKANWRLPDGRTISEEIPFRKEDGTVKIIKNHL